MQPWRLKDEPDADVCCRGEVSANLKSLLSRTANFLYVTTLIAICRHSACNLQSIKLPAHCSHAEKWLQNGCILATKVKVQMWLPIKIFVAIAQHLQPLFSHYLY